MVLRSIVIVILAQCIKFIGLQVVKSKVYFVFSIGGGKTLQSLITPYITTFLKTLMEIQENIDFLFFLC